MTDLSVRFGVDPQVGHGDFGVLSSDLTALFVAVGEAAREEESAVLVAIDELQRLFDYPSVGALSRDEAFEAIRLPAQNGGVEIENAALKKLFEITKGYPYFVQEWAHSVWNGATQSPITLNDVDRVEQDVLARLDESIFFVCGMIASVRERKSTYARWPSSVPAHTGLVILPRL